VRPSPCRNPLPSRESSWCAIPYTDRETIQSRPVPPALASAVAGRENEKFGVFYVQDVYQSTQPIEPGTIKALRINRIYGQPTNSKPKLSLASNEIIKGIIGTVPVDADGSAAFRAPAGTPLQLQAIDENGMAVMTMRSFIYLQPGEVVSCVGCHEDRLTTPVPAIPPHLTIHRPAPPAGPQYEGGFSFARTVQPVLDRYCISCHGLEATEGGCDLLGVRENGYSRAHNSLTKRGLVAIAYRNRETGFSVPKDYFAHAGRLAKYLLQDHSEYIELDRESFQRIVDWLDLNAQYYGDYSHNRAEDRKISPQGERALREHIAKQFGGRLADQPFEALVNIALPGESRILKAPLAEKAGGWGQIEDGRWQDTTDAGYRKMAQLVEAAIEPLPYHDVCGTCGRDKCVCGACWVAELRREYLRKDKQQQIAATSK